MGRLGPRKVDVHSRLLSISNPVDPSGVSCMHDQKEMQRCTNMESLGSTKVVILAGQMKNILKIHIHTVRLYLPENLEE